MTGPKFLESWSGNDYSVYPNKGSNVIWQNAQKSDHNINSLLVQINKRKIRVHSMWIFLSNDLHVSLKF